MLIRISLYEVSMLNGSAEAGCLTEEINLSEGKQRYGEVKAY